METKEIETQICGQQDQEAVLESNKDAEKFNGDYRTLSKEEKTVKNSYIYCCTNFYSLPEMIIYMKENHGVSNTTVTKVFRELLKGRNGEAYLRVSQKRMLQRKTLQRMSSGSGVGTST